MIEKTKYYRYEHKNEYSDSFVLKELMLCCSNICCFPTKEEATAHFKEAESIAKEKYLNIVKKVEELKKELGFSIETWVYTPDDSGLEYGTQIEIKVNGYDFTFKQN